MSYVGDEQYPTYNDEVDYAPRGGEPRWIDPNPHDNPCPRCRRREGAWDGNTCFPCGYVKP